jgi:vesicle coat complex subunit
MMIISSNIQTNIFAAQPSVSSKDAELLKPLVPICPFCPEHYHSYVRKNAVFAVYIYCEFENFIPDAPELLQTFLVAESDAICRRNALHCHRSRLPRQILTPHLSG